MFTLLKQNKLSLAEFYYLFLIMSHLIEAFKHANSGLKASISQSANSALSKVDLRKLYTLFMRTYNRDNGVTVNILLTECSKLFATFLELHLKNNLLTLFSNSNKLSSAFENSIKDSLLVDELFMANLYSDLQQKQKVSNSHLKKSLIDKLKISNDVRRVFKTSLNQFFDNLVENNTQKLSQRVQWSSFYETIISQFAQEFLRSSVSTNSQSTKVLNLLDFWESDDFKFSQAYKEKLTHRDEVFIIGVSLIGELMQGQYQIFIPKNSNDFYLVERELLE